MKAIIGIKYGAPNVLQLTETAKPAPKNNEILVKIYASTVSSGDSVARQGSPFSVRFVTGLIKPKMVLGSDFAGRIEAVGQNVTRFQVGDAVFGSSGMKMGTHAEYITLSEKGTVAIKPANMSYEEAAALSFGSTTALAFLRDKAKIQPGHKVLIYGASGSVGTAAIQLAKHFGAEVTGVCSTANLAMVKSLGAEHVIDYTQKDWGKRAQRYDIIFDAVGKCSFAQCQGLLKQNGVFVTVALSLPIVLQTLRTAVSSSKKVRSGVVSGTAADLVYLKKLVEEGTLKPTIDKKYPLSQIAEAHRHVDTGHKKGNVVITM